MHAAISVVTVTRNSADTILDCLASVREQTYPAEHVVIEGGSNDATLDLVDRFGSINVAVVSGPDEGIYDAMNKGIARCSGDVVGTLNADDFYAHDGVLERVARVFDDDNVDACYGDLLYVRQGSGTSRERADAGKHPVRRDGCGRGPAASAGSGLCLDGVAGESTRIFSVPHEVSVRCWRAGAFTPRAFYWGWMPPHPSFFVRRRLYQEFGGYRLDMGSAADYELMLRFLVGHLFRAAYLPEVLVKMRCGGVSNRDLKHRVRANLMDRKAWVVNDLTPYPWTLWLKPLRKLPQWVRQPQGRPVGARGAVS